MKLQKTTWTLLVLVFLLGGFVYIYTSQDNNTQETLTQNQKKIFNFSREDIQSLLIKTPKITLEFAATNNQVTPWQMKQPENQIANAATISFLVDLLVNGKSEKTFTVPIEQKKEYGLDLPQATITVYLKNKQTHQIILGKTDFENKFLYAQVEPKNNQELQVSLVDKSFQYALDRDLSEWKPEK
ncbi:DUF4340 domain-containing protein [Chroococcus sp. FPU101]|uniref:DUF4340 domain-containing protein n=1 Tax=Chroococcus sp. FPU101 TaxID=1974212 RepID=UPI001A8C2657|nr:DUF4340 domain-containing protein [Chroococcus sp. FPU101]GFE68305.1 hypothetical protein CFPU101_09150 [Chroococcus sp. FPU101]